VSDRISVHDLEFADLPAGKIFGPIACPSSDQVRDALLRLAHRHPQHRLFATVDVTRTGARWVHPSGPALERRCIDMVSEFDPSAGTDACLHRVSQPLAGGELVHYWTSESFIGSTRSHLLGDSGFSYITPAILRIAAGEPVPALPEARGGHLPLTRAALSHFGAHPERLVEALTAPRPQPGHSGDTTTVPADWRFTSVGRTAPADVVDAVRTWRDANRAAVSVANTWTAAIRTAFDEAGVSFASPGLRVLVNARRYLPKGATVDGNFATAIYVEPADPREPAEVDAHVRRNLDNGRPLLAMAASGVKQALLRRHGRAAGDVIVDRHPTLTVSYVGRRTEYEPLPADREQVVHYSGVQPEGADGITVVCSLTHGRLSLSASFCDDVVDRAQVVDALERVVRDPISLLPRAARAAASPGL
jgi:hypothetical protein